MCVGILSFRHAIFTCKIYILNVSILKTNVPKYMGYSHIYIEMLCRIFLLLMHSARNEMLPYFYA